MQTNNDASGNASLLEARDSRAKRKGSAGTTFSFTTFAPRVSREVSRVLALVPGGAVADDDRVFRRLQIAARGEWHRFLLSASDGILAAAPHAGTGFVADVISSPSFRGWCLAWLRCWRSGRQRKTAFWIAGVAVELKAPLVRLALAADAARRVSQTGVASPTKRRPA